MRSLEERDESTSAANRGDQPVQNARPPAQLPGRSWAEKLAAVSRRALGTDDLVISQRGHIGRASTAYVIVHGDWSSPAAPVPARASESNAEIATLKERVRKLEARLEQLLAERDSSERGADMGPSDGDEVVVQPHKKWIEANRDLLRAYADSFVALDPDNGIVAHSSDGDEFAAQLESFSPEQRDRVVVFHASMYVR